jgi:hypothetical protein
MKLDVMLAALAVAGESAPEMVGDRLEPGSTCFSIVENDNPVGWTKQTITAAAEGGRATWDIVIHQKLNDGAFEMRDHFVVDRKTMLPIRMASQRGKDRSERHWHRVSVEYGLHRISGTKETATGNATFDIPLTRPTWDGNLWGLTFAALPLEEGETYSIPFWQYDAGFGAFTVKVIASEEVSTPSGQLRAWTVDAGADPEQLLRYRIAENPRQELEFAAGPNGQRLGGVCE